MRRIALILLLLSFTLAPQAQQRRGKSSGKKTAVQKSTTKSGKTRKSGKTSKTQPSSVKSLQNQRQQIQQQIKQQEQRLYSNQQDVRKRLQNLMVINSEIEGKQRTIDTIRKDISSLDQEIAQMNRQLRQLEGQLAVCKERYVKSIRYMHRNRSAQNQLMFVFSADNFSQMFRRMRFMREYASYQHVQGDEVKVQQEAVNRKREELNSVKTQKKTLLAKDEQERKSLEDKQTEQQNVVKTLQNEQRNIQNIIAQQKKKDAKLNAQIDRLIAEEIARQKARAAAEAKRREAAKRKAEAAKKRQEEQARKPSTTRKGGSKSRKEETYVPAEEKEEALMMSSEDRRISGSFESNRGRLPIPITGSYRIVSHFGQYNVDGLRNVKLDNKGIHIKGEPGAKARSIFDGEVSAVFSFGGTMVVMVRHGSYISVYCNLSSVSVHHGQKVSTRQVLGTIGHDNILQFQLRRETAKLNPERWLGR